MIFFLDDARARARGRARTRARCAPRRWCVKTERPSRSRSSLAAGMDSPAFATFRARVLGDADDDVAAASRSDDAATTAVDASGAREERVGGGSGSGIIGLGRFHRVRDYIEHYLMLSDRTVMEDYVVYCLHECERARDAGDVEREFWFYGELVRSDGSEARKCARRGEQAHRECGWVSELVDQRLTRTLALAREVETEEGWACARAHVIAAEHYCYFKEDREAALEHAGMALRTTKRAKARTSEMVLCEIDAIRVMRSTQSMEGNMYEAVALGSRVVAMAREEYHSTNETRSHEDTIERTTWFVELLYEHAMTLRGWRERSARPLTAPELERYAADVLKEAKTVLESYWTRTGTSWRDNATSRKQYIGILCHLADLCENHLDSSHIVVEKMDAEAFSAKSQRLHRALAAGYRVLASTVDPGIFESPCIFCGLTLSPADVQDIIGTNSFEDVEPLWSKIELVSLACESWHHVHSSCRTRAVEADEAYADRALERGLPCRYCANAREIERTRARVRRRPVRLSKSP